MDDTSESAFPVQHQENANGEVRMWGQVGLTKRELFALHLLPGVLDRFWRGVDSHQHDCPSDWREGTSQDACLQADALLRALSEPRPEPEPAFPFFNVYAASADQKDALRRLHTRTWFDQLPDAVRTYVTDAVDSIARTEAGEDDIPF